MPINEQKKSLDETTYIITEAGANNNINFYMTKKLIDVKADVKTVALKSQTYIDETLYSMKTSFHP